MQSAGNFVFPNNTGMSQLFYICILIISTFCLYNYSLTGYCVSYSCHLQYLLKYDICTYCYIWPNQLRFHRPIFVAVLWEFSGLIYVCYGVSIKQNMHRNHEMSCTNQCIALRIKTWAGLYIFNGDVLKYANVPYYLWLWNEMFHKVQN